MNTFDNNNEWYYNGQFWKETNLRKLAKRMISWSYSWWKHVAVSIGAAHALVENLHKSGWDSDDVKKNQEIIAWQEKDEIMTELDELVSIMYNQTRKLSTLKDHKPELTMDLLDRNTGSNLKQMSEYYKFIEEYEPIELEISRFLHMHLPHKNSNTLSDI